VSDTCPTVKVKSGDSFAIVINESDFDAEGARAFRRYRPPAAASRRTAAPARLG
jgi:hypothetical protein